MKIKNLLLNSVAIFGFSATTMAQINCNLIDSITLNVPNQNQILARFSNQRGPSTPFQYLTYNQWHHLAITKSNLNGKVFIDGNLVINGQWANNAFNWSSLYLGAEYFTGWSVFFNGMLDDIRISDIVRSDSEIIGGYNQNQPYSLDSNTIGLWHFDELSGSSFSNSVANQTSGSLFNGPVFQSGKFNNGVFFDGIDDRGNCNFNMPENNFTIELWIKPIGPQATISCFMQPYGIYNSPMYITPDTIQTNYFWSTGDTGNSVTVNPATLPYVWVTDGNCSDTVWFNSQSATFYDTTYVTVTDTLLINTTVTGINPPNNFNLIKVFPNPASTHITIDYGNFSIMNGYELRIENSLGQQVFMTNITQQSDYLSLANWGGNGIYFVHIIDPQGNTIDIRKIVLQ
jgi:hypothetical protein